jgi:hypothetical protein
VISTACCDSAIMKSFDGYSCHFDAPGAGYWRSFAPGTVDLDIHTVKISICISRNEWAMTVNRLSTTYRFQIWTSGDLSAIHAFYDLPVLWWRVMKMYIEHEKVFN